MTEEQAAELIVEIAALIVVIIGVWIGLIVAAVNISRAIDCVADAIRDLKKEDWEGKKPKRRSGTRTMHG